jgi:hypothetical protein
LVFFCVWVFGGRIRKAGPSKQSGGLFARPWLFRRKANPSPLKKTKPGGLVFFSLWTFLGQIQKVALADLPQADRTV